MGMTDAELRDAAWKELEQTTIGWLKPNGQPRPQPGTHWKAAKVLLDQIGKTSASSRSVPTGPVT